MISTTNYQAIGADFMEEDYYSEDSEVPWLCCRTD